MELGQFQLQFGVSIALILGASILALICDSLRRNNEQLRALTIELKARHDEGQKRSQLVTPRVSKTRNIAAPKQRTRTVNPEAMAAMERGAALAGSGGRPLSAAPQQKPVKKDWGTLLDRNARAKAAQPSLPAGFQDGSVLTKLIESRQPVSGLVVSIGVDGKRPQAVHELVESLIGPNDFAAQSGAGKFLLIFPKESGASAQRRLSQIAQQLWDFQLRSLGSSQILFSWGGVEVRGESLEAAITSASERMQETKLRQAV